MNTQFLQALSQLDLVETVDLATYNVGLADRTPARLTISKLQQVPPGVAGPYFVTLSTPQGSFGSNPEKSPEDALRSAVEKYRPHALN